MKTLGSKIINLSRHLLEKRVPGPELIGSSLKVRRLRPEEPGVKKCV